MKKIVILVSIILLFTYCKKEDTKICGCDDPTTELQWLNELIQKAETDTTGLYKGQIFFDEVNNQELFWVLMQLDSVNGGIDHWFNCAGEKMNFEIYEIPNDFEASRLIYSNIN